MTWVSGCSSPKSLFLVNPIEVTHRRSNAHMHHCPVPVPMSSTFCSGMGGEFVKTPKGIRDMTNTQILWQGSQVQFAIQGHRECFMPTKTVSSAYSREH